MITDPLHTVPHNGYECFFEAIINGGASNLQADNIESMDGLDMTGLSGMDMTGLSGMDMSGLGGLSMCINACDGACGGTCELCVNASLNSLGGLNGLNGMLGEAVSEDKEENKNYSNSGRFRGPSGQFCRSGPHGLVNDGQNRHMQSNGGPSKMPKRKGRRASTMLVRARDQRGRFTAGAKSPYSLE